MQSLFQISLIVASYDEAIAFYVDTLGFELLEDTPIPEENKRWVVISPKGKGGCAICLAEAKTPEELAAIGQQGAGRVWLFLGTDDFWRDYQMLNEAGVTFVREPLQQPYGTVAVFADPYGNLWDLIEHAEGHPFRLG
jgi:catechol 2,3-dioxygenase-like lactoylglutathione lyase family enzyme